MNSGPAQTGKQQYSGCAGWRKQMRHPPTDAEVEAMLEERLVEKYLQ